jgi:hypothetical protein
MTSGEAKASTRIHAPEGCVTALDDSHTMHIAYQTPLFPKYSSTPSPGPQREYLGSVRKNERKHPRPWLGTINRDAPKGLLVRGAIRSSQWGDSPQGVGRFAPLCSLPTTSIGNRARIGNFAHELTHRLGRISGERCRYSMSQPVPATPYGQPSATPSALFGPPQKHHRAEHLAMPCPA